MLHPPINIQSSMILESVGPKSKRSIDNSNFGK
jgi:hypothetical protein